MKRLYRSPVEKKIAGVCGGLGEYFGVDPVFFRGLFIVLAFLWGIGILAYIVMWIMVPMKGEAPEGIPQKRLHLSKTDRKIAGVCGGLGEYFDVDPVLFRVIFIVLAFVGGLGILLYIVLWLVMPQDTTAAPPAPERQPAEDV